MSDTRTLKVLIVGNSRSAQKAIRGLDADVQRTGSSIGRIGSRMASVMGGAARNVTHAMGVATAAATYFAVKSGSEYESSLNRIQALTNSSTRELLAAQGRLEGQAKSFAAYGFSVNDATASVEELTKAGLSLRTSLATVDDALVLARAGTISTDKSANFLSNTMHVFGLNAGQAGEIVDALAGAANQSSADIDDIRLAMGQASNVADLFGLSLDQTAAAIAALHNAGLRGSDAGTSLKTMLLRLAAPSTAAGMTLKELGVNIYDAEGKTKSFSEIMSKLGPALRNLDNETRNIDLKSIFGDDAFRSAKILFNDTTSTQFDRLTVAVGRAGAAEKLAEANSEGFSGAMRRAKATAESYADILYMKAAPSMAEFTNAALDNLDVFIKDYGPGIESTVRRVASATMAIVRDIDFAELINEFGDFVSRTVDLGEALAQNIAPAVNTVAGPLRIVNSLLNAVAAVVVPLADGFNALPDGIKQTALALGLAAVATSRFNAASEAQAVRLGNLGLRVQGVRDSLLQGAPAANQWKRALLDWQPIMALTSQETLAARAAVTSYSRTLLSRGVAALKGPGGMTAALGAVALASQSSNKAVQGFATIGGGALMGLMATGGPVGAAIGGMIGLGVAASHAGDGLDDVVASASSVANSGDFAAMAEQVERLKAELVDRQNMTGLGDGIADSLAAAWDTLRRGWTGGGDSAIAKANGAIDTLEDRMMHMSGVTRQASRESLNNLLLVPGGLDAISDAAKRLDNNLASMTGLVAYSRALRALKDGLKDSSSFKIGNIKGESNIDNLAYTIQSARNQFDKLIGTGRRAAAQRFLTNAIRDLKAVLPPLDKLPRSLRIAMQDLQKLNVKEAKPKIKADPSFFEKALAGALSGLSALDKAKANPFVGMFTDGFDRGAAHVYKTLADISAAQASATVVINTIRNTLPGSGGGKGGGGGGKKNRRVTMPRLAKGGVVSKPTVALIGEAGKEAVIPLKKDPLGLGKLFTPLTKAITVDAKSKADGNKGKGGKGGGKPVFVLPPRHDVGTDMTKWLKNHPLLAPAPVGPGGIGHTNPSSGIGDAISLDASGGFDNVKFTGKLGEQFASALLDLDRSMRDALKSGTFKEFKDSIQDIRDSILDSFASGDISADAKNNLLKFLNAQQDEMEKIVRKREELADKLQKAQDKLDELKSKLTDLKQARTDMIESAKDTIAGYAGLSNLLGDNTAQNGFNDAQSILGRLSTRLDNIRSFGSNLSKLIDAGLNKNLVMQIASAGPDQGGTLAAALADVVGNQSMIDQFNQIQDGIDAAGQNIGTFAADYVYNDQIASAQAAVDAQKTVIQDIKIEINVNERNADNLAQAIARAVREEIRRIEKRSGG